MYVDKQRNVAVALGERDVKADVTAKNRYVAVALGERGRQSRRYCEEQVLVVALNKERNVKRNVTAKNRYTVVARGDIKTKQTSWLRTSHVISSQTIINVLFLF
jgi:hypothetical protein